MAELIINPKVSAIEFKSPVQRKKPVVDRKAAFENAKQRTVAAIKKDGGRFVRFEEKRYGLLVCAVECQKKLNFLYIDKDRKIECVPVSETFSLMRQLPGDLSVLNYIYNHQKEELSELVRKYLEENKQFVPVSDIVVSPQRRDDSFDKNKKKKNVQKK